jgi:excisionase family DNA binding protein
VSDRLIPLMELAKQWGWSRSKLWRLVVRKEIPHVRIGPRGDVHFRESQVEAWLEARTVGDHAVATPSTRSKKSFAEEFGLSAEDAEMFT